MISSLTWLLLRYVEHIGGFARQRLANATGIQSTLQLGIIEVKPELIIKRNHQGHTARLAFSPNSTSRRIVGAFGMGHGSTFRTSPRRIPLVWGRIGSRRFESVAT